MAGQIHGQSHLFGNECSNDMSNSLPVVLQIGLTNAIPCGYENQKCISVTLSKAHSSGNDLNPGICIVKKKQPPSYASQQRPNYASKQRPNNASQQRQNFTSKERPNNASEQRRNNASQQRPNYAPQQHWHRITKQYNNIAK